MAYRSRRIWHAKAALPLAALAAAAALVGGAVVLQNEAVGQSHTTQNIANEHYTDGVKRRLI